MSKELKFGLGGPRLGLKRDLAMRPDDVIISSYPRSGTTWTIEILRRIHLLRITDSTHYLHHTRYMVHGIWIDPNPHNTNGPRTKQEFNLIPSPRVIKSHLQYKDLPCPEGGVCKIIHVARDPAEVVCSMFIHAKDHNAHTTNFDTFVDDFIEGKRHDWWERTQSFLTNIHQLPILFLKFAELKSDPEASFIRINEFLGYPALTPAELALIEHQTSYDVMKFTHTETMLSSTLEKPQLDQDQQRRIEEKTRMYFGLNKPF